MNREEFVDIFSQNVRVSGGERRFYAELTYTGNEASSLVHSAFGSRILAIPVGEGFRVLMSRNSSLNSSKAKQGLPKPVRATRRAFRNIRDVAGKSGFRLYDITLTRAGENVVSVSADSNIASEVYERYSGDSTSTPEFLGFRKEGCSVSFSVDMRVTCQGYIRDAGGFIFDSIQGILSESSIYVELYQSFSPKYDDQWTARINPVNIKGKTGGKETILDKLGTSLPAGFGIRLSKGSSIYFSHDKGLWGEIACLEDSMKVYFMAEADFDLGIELIDALKELVQN